MARLLRRIDDYLVIHYVRANGHPNVAIRLLDALYGLALRMQWRRLTYAQRVARDAPVLFMQGDDGRTERRVDTSVTLEEGVKRARVRCYYKSEG